MTGLFYARRNPYNFWVARKAQYFDTMEQAQDEAERLNALQQGAEFNSILESENTALTAEVARLREAMLEACEHIEQHRYSIGILALNEALAQEVAYE